jgi:four helix bundle protein
MQFSVLGSQFSVIHGGMFDSSLGFTGFHSRLFRYHSEDKHSIMQDIMGDSYKDLIAWRQAMELVTEIYRATRAFPRDEIYSLTNQLRRAAVSVPSNIAEGQARFSRKEFHHFLSQARGSLVEVETQLMIVQNLDYLSPQQTRSLLDKAAELGKVLNGLIAAIKSAA